MPSVACLCGHAFCFGCDLDAHMPVLCDLAKRWLAKCRDDPKTAQWIVSFNKACPTCHLPIEKNGGCSHIRCQHCGHDFCWLCLKAWSSHKSASCNALAREGPPTDSTAAADRSAYLHCFARYTHHTQSSTLDKRLRVLTDDKILALQLSAALPSAGAQFLKDASAFLVRCRDVLKWSYALAFYLAPDANKTHFEGIQWELELATEALSGLLGEAIDLTNLPRFQKRIDKQIREACQRKDHLVAFVFECYYERFWKYTVAL